MALTELTALDNAYRALEPLGQEARRRALQWLSDALNHGETLLVAPANAETTDAPIETVEVSVPASRPRATKSATATSPNGRPGRRLKGATRQAPAKQPKTKGERPYRRMPDPEAIMKVYRKVGTVSGLADRFEVPRHTVNHWARRLRSQGYAIGR